MLAQKYRFHGYGSLKYVFKNGTKARNRYIGLRTVPNPRREHHRVSVIVSRKIHKSAVVRNRIRRRVYEIVRRELPRYTGVNDIAITILSPEIIAATPIELTAAIQQLSAELGLYESIS